MLKVRFWLTGVLLVGSLVLLGLLSCRAAPSPSPTPPPPPPTPSPAPPPAEAFTGPQARSAEEAGLRLEMRTDKPDYRPGETVRVRLTLVNTTRAEVTVSTGTSQLFEVHIKAPGQERESRWSDGQSFLQVTGTHRIAAGEGLSRILELKLGGAVGEVQLRGATVNLRLDNREVTLDTSPVKITVR